MGALYDESVELTREGEAALSSALRASAEIGAILDESWSTALSGFDLSAFEKSVFSNFPEKARSIKDELNRIVIVEEPQFDMRTPTLGGMPPVAQIAASEDGAEGGERLSQRVDELRRALHKLMPEIEGSDFAVRLNRLLSGVDAFDAMAPTELAKMEIRKDGDGATNGTGLPGSMPIASENVVITPDLNQGGKLSAAQGGKAGGPFENGRFSEDTLRGLSDREVRSRDTALHRLYADADATSKPTIVAAHRSVVAELDRRDLAHSRDDALTHTSTKKITKAIDVVRILKSVDQFAGDERYVLGIVLEPNDGQEGAPLDPDAQKDVYSRDDIRQTAHAFMAEYQQIGLMHEELISRGVRILESYLAPCDLAINEAEIRCGTWLLALRVLSDGVWSDIKDGLITGFSIGGDARRTPVGKS